MSQRKTYQPHELRAGRTVFIVNKTRSVGCTEFFVAQHLIASKREPQPDPNQAPPYRMHPKMALYAAGVTDLWRTRRAAQAEASRRQRASQ